MPTTTCTVTTSNQSEETVALRDNGTLLAILTKHQKLWFGTTQDRTDEANGSPPSGSPEANKLIAAADFLGHFLQGITRHLQRCDCETSVQVEDFLHRRLEVVAAVLAEMRTPTPSPIHLKRLVLQLVIDPRVPVATDRIRYQFRDDDSEVWLVRQPPGGRLTGKIEKTYECYDPFVRRIHFALEKGPSSFWDLRKLLEESFPQISFLSDAHMPGAAVPNDVRALRAGIQISRKRLVVTIDSETFAVTEEGANLIAAMIDLGYGEWYAGREIQEHEIGGLCGRVDRTRKQLPDAVQKWIETTRHGYRLKRPSVPAR